MFKGGGPEKFLALKISRKSPLVLVKVRERRTERWEVGSVMFKGHVGFEVLTTVAMKRAIFWDVKPCS
jgi:hypothetical protein